MQQKQLTYITLLLIHLGLGFFLFLFPFLSKLFGLVIIGIGVLVIIKNKNQNNEALYASAYMIGVEVLLRMTDGVFLNEQGKYGVISFLFLGMLYRGFSKYAFVYWIFLLLLIPGVVLSTTELSLEADIKKAIFFNITGPVCLGVASIYCYRRRITFEQLNNIVIAMALPIVSILTYLFLYTPSIEESVTGTSSNFETSGGFGPNQMSTILGLGTFLFFALLLLNSKSKKIILIHTFLLCLVAFRGVVTFSRGGVYTGLVMVIILLLMVYKFAKSGTKVKLVFIAIGALLLGLGVWAYSSVQTSGLIDRRYANEDARGRQKESELSGRETLIATELQMFVENPILGIGVGRNKEYRKELTGIEAASHNELSRMLAEHGSLGILGLLILILTPLFLSLDNKQNLYLFSFFAFWLLTINHAAMRIAAPAFVYALSLLKVVSIEKPPLHRE
ncbi:O-antigen ligase family protein [Flavobacterium soli]|uniref:O-antigen ligase family protein n=1 Tax=Flavobacterium soli TaxID=344881 RepID=UPI0003F53318|nr:O-antigen ligase family protein [Flavobacterium soli]